MKIKADCDHCEKREATAFLYPADSDPAETEAGDVETVCEYCIPDDARQLSPFSWQEKWKVES